MNFTYLTEKCKKQNVQIDHSKLEIITDMPIATDKGRVYKFFGTMDLKEKCTASLAGQTISLQVRTLKR